ncbi:uncharacterized protein LOC126373054 [Pectinophora gossypiella]|uniref:uncharacterized protein LOC126373054 n=1 Tax=Pectinophora gossypiella TaxID=13191 RepID=UPI00214E2B36|nr:uncharacterized protein LOC126373054 [Pectinophora gossypiella]
MAALALWLFVLAPVVCGNQENAREGLMDHLTHGMKFASNLLGSESVALKVAEFVVRAFQNANNPPSKPIRRRPLPDAYEEGTSDEETFEKRPDYNINEVPTPMTPLKHLVRLFGLQPNQISAVAVNALVFVAQMISTFLAGPKRPSRPYRVEDPTSWILNKNSRSLQDLLATAKNESLPETIEDLIKQQGSDEETSCIRLLVCKITPFVNRMQKAVFGNDSDTVFDDNLKGSAVLYRHLPTEEEINRRSEVCEKKHADCDLNEL